MTAARRWSRDRIVPRGTALFAAAAFVFAGAAPNARLALHTATTRSPAQRTNPRITQAVLANGLRVAVVENHDVPVVDVGMWYPFGSANEPARVAGVAHALEHMAFRGTRALSGTGLDELEAEVGSDANAETDYEYTHFEQTLPSENLAVALHVEADRMRGLLLRERDWRIERGAVLEEGREDDASSIGTLESAVRARAYAGTPFARDIGGGNASVNRITAADLRRAYERGYAPGGATLVVTGDAEPRAVFALAHALFGPLRGRTRAAPVGSEAPVHRGFRVATVSFGDSTVVDIALESHGFLGPANAVEDLAAELLGPEHAVLTGALVEHGPCESYRIDDDTQRYGGLYHVACTLRAGRRPDGAVLAFSRTLRAFAAHPPPAAIATARRADIGNTAFTSDDLQGEAGLFGLFLFAGGIDVRDVDRAVAVTPDARVAAVLRRWAVPVGIGVSTPRNSAVPAVQRDGAGTKRLERPQQASPEEPVVRPAWARAALQRPAPAIGSDDRIETFALPNGLRVFLRQRTDTGTLYMRAGFDGGPPPAGRDRNRIALQARLALALGGAHWTKARVAHTARLRGMKIDLDTKTTAQGTARDLSTMLDIVADTWRRPRAFAAAGGAPQSVRAFLAARLRPERAWIAFAGNADAAKLRAQAARSFASWRPSGVALAEGATPPPLRLDGLGDRGTPHVYRSARPTVRVLLVRSAPRRGTPDYPAMTVVNAVLGGQSGFDTRLVREVRVRRGLAYFAGSLYGDNPDGALLIAFESAPGAFRRARTVVRSVLDGMATKPPAPAEIERARRKLVAAALRAETTPDGVLDVLETAARTRSSPVGAADVARDLDRLTVADIARVARAYLRPSTFFEIDEGEVR